jgi:hypothetical protein
MESSGVFYSLTLWLCRVHTHLSYPAFHLNGQGVADISNMYIGLLNCQPMAFGSALVCNCSVSRLQPGA